MPTLFLLFNLDKTRRRGLLLRLVWRLEALLLGGVWLGLRALPVDTASALGRRLLGALGPRFYKSDKVRRNLALACPDLPETELDALVQQAWGNYGAVLAEFPHLDHLWHLWRGGQEGRIEMVGAEHLEAKVRAGKPSIFALAHLGNWSLATLLARRYGLPLVAVESTMRNPYLARLFDRAHGRLGCDFIDRRRGPREVLRRIQQGQSVALVADVRIDAGEPVPMFGQDVPTTLIPARLALRSGCDLVPVRMQRLEGVHFRVTIEAPIRPGDPTASRKEQALDMTRQLNARYTAWIREHPEQWLCFKRRAYKPRELAALAARRKRLARRGPPGRPGIGRAQSPAFPTPEA